MGLLGTFAYSAGRWSTGRPTAVPFLLIDVHDSRVATVDYRAADATGGRFFLGYEPRIYFEEPDASAPLAPRRPRRRGGGVRAVGPGCRAEGRRPGRGAAADGVPIRSPARGRGGGADRRAAPHPRRAPAARLADGRRRARRLIRRPQPSRSCSRTVTCPPARDLPMAWQIPARRG